MVHPEIIAKVERGMRRMGALEAHIPSIRYLLAVDPGTPDVAAMDAATRRKKLLDAALALPVRGARRRPLVLVFEDLHWSDTGTDGADTSTEEYLRVLMDSVVAVPLLLLVTYRVGYTPPFGSRSFHTTLTLRSLSEADSLTIAGRVLGSAQFPEELKTALMAKAEGIPLFIEEVTKTLLDLGVLRREHEGYRLVKGLAEVHVPDTIQAIIMARLDRLGEDGKRVVQLAFGHWPPVPGAPPGAHLRARWRAGGVAARVAGLGDRLRAGTAPRAGLCLQARGDPGGGLSEPPGAAAQGTASRRRRGA